jgi:8-hydroxy-5-deazaflavin:NADPH oxidoreductase
VKIAVVGKGNVGGGLAERWEKAGHDVQRLGRDGFASNAEFIKSKTAGPTAKSFNINFAAIYDRIDAAGARPGNLWCGDEEARAAVERLNRDAGFDPIYAGGLENAALQESMLRLVFAINQGGMGAFFYRMAPPDQF